MIRFRIKWHPFLNKIHPPYYPSCILSIIYLSISTVYCQQLPMISDKSVVDIPLTNYSVSDPGGESVELKYFMKPNSNCIIQIVDVPVDVHFVLVQVHSYLKNVTLSYNKKPTRNTSVTGMNIGLLKMNTSPVLSYYLSYNSSSDNVIVMIAVQAYGINAPIPGGCNMEFQVEISPFLKTIFDETITEVDFAPASPPSPSHVLFNPLILTDNLCNIKPHPVTYKIYRMYLPEGNLSHDLYFDSIKSMITKGRILKNGRSIPDKHGPSSMRYSFASYPGIGNVFVVIAESKTGSSVYIPSFSYSCWIDQKSNNCRVLTTTFSKLLCAAIFFLGLFLCLAAHRFFKIELFFLGFIVGAFLCQIVAQKLNSSATLTTSVGVGLAVGVAFIIVWCLSGLPLFPLITATTVLGYLVASSVFYNLIDVFDVLVNDVSYYSIFCSIILLCPILMISLSEKANIIACSIVGSYVSISAIDYYIGSNLRFIIINTIRRATDSRFRYAIADPPFQTRDIALTSVWAVLAVAGVTVQLILVKGRPPYPAPSNFFRTIVQRCKAAVSYRQSSPTETTPLLRSATTYVNSWEN